MLLLLFRICIDFGLMILVHITQWISYPSLAEMDDKSFQKWHPKYANRITIWVLPLMALQYLALALQLFDEVNPINIISLLLVIYSTYITFRKAVPIHNSLLRSEQRKEDIQRLIHWNTHRTLAWSLVFLLGMVELLDH